MIWDRYGTAERRREFAELLFSRVTVDQYSRTRAWALNSPFQRLFEFAQPGAKLVLDGDPERTRGRKYHRSFSNTFRALPGERRGNRTLGKRDEYEDGGRKTRQASHGHADEPVQA